MLVELSKSQDIEAGDGTTSVVVLCGSMLSACSDLLNKGIHPTVITSAFQLAVEKSEEILKTVAIPVRAGWSSQQGRVRVLSWPVRLGPSRLT
jgi:T-complex protein 1 subunit delta